YYADLAESAELGLRGAEQAHWAARLAGEHDNFQAALRWTTAQGEAELAHRLVAALAGYWFTRPRGVDGTHWFKPVLALGSEHVAPSVRARALAGGTELALLEGDIALTRQHCLDGYAIFQTLGDTLEHGQTLIKLGILAAIGGNPQAARSRFEEALAMFRRL